MIEFIEKNWVNILLIIVGLSAFGVYFWQKADERRIAATLIKGQIDLIETRILALKNDHQLGNIAIYHSKVIMQENFWEKYKHLIVKKINKSDAELIQKFFNSAEQIERTRSDITQTIKQAWEHKSQVEHQIVGELIKSEIDKKIPDGKKGEVEIAMNKVEAFRQIYRPLDLVFTPDVAINTLVKYLNDFDMLTGTTAYKMIQSYSYDKK